MKTPEKVYELVKELPENQAMEVLNFAEFLKHKIQLQAQKNSQTEIGSQLDALPTNTELQEKTTVSLEEFETLADQIADEFMRFVGSNVPSLPDAAISRAGIYEEHP